MITISAILPTFNDASFLEKSINSLVNQTANFQEIIIVNDGSTDNTSEILSRFAANHPNIQVITLAKNVGVCEALNIGISYATSDYLLLCASDDWYDQTLVHTCQKLCDNAVKPGLICADAIMYQKHRKIIKNYRRTVDIPDKNTYISPAQFKNLIKHKYIGFNGGATLILRQAAVKAGKLFPSLRWHSDWFLHYVVALRFGLTYVNQVFTHVTLRKSGYGEGNKQWRAQKQVYIAFINLLRQDYPELWLEFKNAAILPRYETHYLKDFLTNNILKDYFTKRLLWKLLMNNFITMNVAKIVPYSLVLFIRKSLNA